MLRLHALAQRKTVATAMAEWQLDRAAGWSDRYASEVKRIVDVEIAPSMGNRALKDTTREDWTNLVAAKKRKAPAMASSIYRTIAAFLGHAEAQGWIDSPLLPRKGLTTIAPAAAARGRVLTDDELKAVLQAADKVSVKCKTFIWLLAATAVREAEAADISIGELDLVNSVWTIAGVRTKNGQTLAVPLPNNLVAALHGLYPTHVKPAASWKLLGAISGSGFRGFSKLKATIDRHSGVGEWRWHDLRRTARTGMTRLGVSREHAEAAINHISGRSKLERTYNQHDYGPEIIAALKRWQNHVAAIVSEQPTAAIVQLRRGL
jgi:integrase